MLLIYQMKFYKWCLSVGRTLLCVLEMEIEQMYESMSNCPCQRPFEWDLSDGRRSNSVDQFWWTSFAQSSNRFRALHHAEFRKCHVLAYRAASSLLFYTQFIYSFLAPPTEANDVSRQCLVAIYCMCALYPLRQWWRNSNLQIGLHAQPRTTKTKYHLHELDPILNHSNYSFSFFAVHRNGTHFRLNSPSASHKIYEPFYLMEHFIYCLLWNETLCLHVLPSHGK